MTNTGVIRKADKPRLSVKTQVIATFAAIVGAVVIPQLFHVMGAVSGLGTALGETFLPMHLPIILVGLLAGPYAGAIAGFFGPLVSFGLTAMPGAALLPFMMLELCAYGLFAGLLRNVKMPGIAKVVAVQVIGRVMRAVAILIAFYGIGSKAIPVSIIWTSIAVGVPGLVLQWCLIPLVDFRVNAIKKHE